jgi:prepilin signal peptidase PulO-like enzyme (type II secretory pathway)
MRGHNFERHLPFGPFLILGFWIIWLFPDAFMAR